jgi:hypothetical protein
VSGPQAPGGSCDDVGRKREQQHGSDPAGGSFGALRKSLSMSQFHIEAPNENARRCQLDCAIKPESHQRQTPGCQTSAKRRDTLNHHPCDRHPLKAKRLPNQRGALRCQRQCRRGGAAARICAAFRQARLNDSDVRNAQGSCGSCPYQKSNPNIVVV